METQQCPPHGPAQSQVFMVDCPSAGLFDPAALVCLLASGLASGHSTTLHSAEVARDLTLLAFQEWHLHSSSSCVSGGSCPVLWGTQCRGKRLPSSPGGWTLPPGFVTSLLSQDPCAQTGQRSNNTSSFIDSAGLALSSSSDQW